MNSATLFYDLASIYKAYLSKPVGWVLTIEIIGTATIISVALKSINTSAENGHMIPL